MVTRYESCIQTQRRSWPPLGERHRLSMRLASVLRELDVDQKMRVASSNGGFT
jgi:hypothetical protein